MMSNTMLTSLTNALTEIATRRAEMRPGERQTARDGNEPDNFGSLVSEWARSAPGPQRSEARPVPPRENAPDPSPRANPAAEEQDAPRGRPDDTAPKRADRKDDRADDATKARADERRSADEARETQGEAEGDKPEGEETAEAQAGGDESGETDAIAKAEGDEAAAADKAGTTEGEATDVTAETAVAVAVDTPVDADGIAAVPAAVPAPAGEAPADGDVVAATGAAAMAAKAATEATATTEANAAPAKDAGTAAIVAPAGKSAPDAGATAETTGVEAGSLLAAAETSGKGAKAAETATNPVGTEAKAQGAGQGHHPVRTTPFAELFHGMGTQNAIYRPADILAGLDRSLPTAGLGQAETAAIRPTPLQMLPIEIGMQAVRGVTNFQIRLDPAELGRVDVKLQIKENGEVNASLVVDRVETLQMLRRDASTLQQAFEQAGLKQSADGLTFSLRGEGQSGQQQERGRQGSSQQGLEDIGTTPQMGELVMRRALIPNTSLDLMI